MNGPTAYPAVPWRTGPLGEDERRSNLTLARNIMGAATDPDADPPPPTSARLWAAVAS